MPKIKKTSSTKDKKVKEKKTVKNLTGLMIPVYDIKGKEINQIELPKEIFNYKVNKSLIAQALRVYQFNQRQGTASTKTRGEVIGSTRKIYRQKGTGRARHGSIKAPIFVGGGVAGGPKPKKYSLKITKKQKRKAIFSGLTFMFKNKKIIGLDKKTLTIDSKTKYITQFLKSLNLINKKIVFILPKMEKNNFVLAARNIQGVNIIDVKSLNIFQVFNYDRLIFFEDSIEIIKNHFLKNEY